VYYTPDKSIRAETYLFFGQNSLLFNENPASDASFLPAGSGIGTAPLYPGPKPDREIAD